jgi:hypothetical protein
VGIAAAQIGLDHEAGDDVGITGRKPDSFEGALDEGRQRRCCNARHIGRARWFGFGRRLS